MSQFKRRALQAACAAGVIFGMCGCVATKPTVANDQQPDPRTAAPRSLSMGAGDSMGQNMFGRPQQVATIEDGAE
jgi:hypothetical protein